MTSNLVSVICKKKKLKKKSKARDCQPRSIRIITINSTSMKKWRKIGRRTAQQNIQNRHLNMIKIINSI